jgi:hypothetical protein
MYLKILDKDVKESYAKIVARWFIEKQENKLKDKSQYKIKKIIKDFT